MIATRRDIGWFRVCLPSAFRRWGVIPACALALLLEPGQALGKKVICVDDGAKGASSVFNHNHEGWERANMGADDVIQIGGSLTDCLDQAVDGDTIIIIAHGSKTTSGQQVTDTGFHWGQNADGTPITYTGFGSGTNEMPVPADFAQLDNVTVKFCSCWSTLTPREGVSVKDDLVGEMGGEGNHGTGFTGVANAGMSLSLAGKRGISQAVIDNIGTALGENDSWAEHPPANRPNADNPDANNTTQQSAAQAVADAKTNGAVNVTIEYTEPTDKGEGTRSVPDITWGCGCEDGVGCGIGTATFSSSLDVPVLTRFGLAALTGLVLLAGVAVLRGQRSRREAFCR